MRGLLTAGLAAGLLLLAAGAGAADDPATAPAGWRPPAIQTLPDDAFGRAVRLGRELFQHSSALIGPDAPDPGRRYAGNGLDCRNCHLDAGRQRLALPLAGTHGVYPDFSGRAGRVLDLGERIQSCMERSMNGRRLPEDGPELVAILAYLRFLATGLPTGAEPPGRGTPPLALPERAADPKRGAALYQQNCAACHQPDGQGVRYGAADAAQQRQRYQFPPLWGPDSFNDGAGMARTIAAARFIRANMPLGTDPANPSLAPDDAFDIAAFLAGQPRPRLAGTEADFPDRRLKPPDAPYPPFLGPFPPAQHLTGPWQPILEWQHRHLGPGAGADLASAVPGR
ncbi:MAG: c-type cytochrome [Dongiaceae bacterium]